MASLLHKIPAACSGPFSSFLEGSNADPPKFSILYPSNGENEVTWPWKSAESSSMARGQNFASVCGAQVLFSCRTSRGQVSDDSWMPSLQKYVFVLY